MEPLRYVVLFHEGFGEPHYDLMFETSPGSNLATWRAPAWPLKTGMPIQHLAEHRRAYLDYEGPISNNRGQVKRVAAGTHQVEQDHPILLIVRLDTGPVLRLFRAEQTQAQVLGEFTQ